ncbi:serine hydrolase domain-containing protein [Streptomyces sp. NPDC001985]|uniref:serine hydrolase domain-containing protein n=1 Tax=Streptomyces sp. NPDC001985 TaxID=3154406 RepID=UPI00332E5B3A
MPPISERARSTEELLETVADAAGGRAATVVMVHTGAGTTSLCRGFTDQTGAVPVTERTRFELGSVTKTFTALLFADMAARGTVRLDEPLSARVPRWALPRGPVGGGITLEHLATHTSGLPRLPPGLLRTAVPSWTTNPYQAYPAHRLLDSLSRSRVRRPPGLRVHYSNFGVGLLGHLLAERGTTGYGPLLMAQVVKPLGLTDTTAETTGVQATGHWHGRPRPPFTIPALPGAGVLRSSGRDLLRYLRCLITPELHAGPGDPLRLALREVTRVRPRTPGGPELCLAWSHNVLPTRRLYFHLGATRGFTSFIGFCPDPAVAVVALTNISPTLRCRYTQAAYELLRTVSLRQAG